MPEGNAQSVPRAWVILHTLKEGECLGITFLLQELGGLVDGGSSGVGHVVVVDAQVARIALVGQQVLLDVGEGAALVEVAQPLLAAGEVGLAVDEDKGLAQGGQALAVGFGAAGGHLADDVVDLVAQFSPCLASARHVEEGIGGLWHLLLHVLLECLGAVG